MCPKTREGSKIASRPIATVAPEASTIAGISRLTTLAWTARGAMSAAMPRMSPMLAMFEPITFPKLRPVFSLRAAMMFSASSGALVPKATIVSPTISRGTPSRRASAPAPRTSVSPPAMSSATPTRRA